MPTVFVTRLARFNAAHRLHNPQKSDEWNQETFGKCNSPNFHGHNYTLEVTVAGEPHPDTGYVVDLSDLKRIMNELVVDKLDHSNMNVDVDFLTGVLPSTENVAVAIWRQLENEIPGGRLHCVRLQETMNNSVAYYGE
ncbi:6-carboxytetrahydropterin synthase [soil metagenome]